MGIVLLGLNAKWLHPAHGIFDYLRWIEAYHCRVFYFEGEGHGNQTGAVG
jgi:hypothetical protein